jgi:hypothetical protein
MITFLDLDGPAEINITDLQKLTWEDSVLSLGEDGSISTNFQYGDEFTEDDNFRFQIITDTTLGGAVFKIFKEVDFFEPENSKIRGSIVFLPNKDAFGLDHFSLLVTDGDYYYIHDYEIRIYPLNDEPTGNLTISGEAIEGETLAADASNIEDADGLGTLSYQWLKDDVNILGANATIYELTTEDVGSTISVRVNYTDEMGTDEFLISEMTSLISSKLKTIQTSVVTRDGSKIADVDVDMSDGTNSFSYTSAADGSVSGSLTSGSDSTVTGSLAYSNSTKAVSSQDALDALKLSVGMTTGAGTTTAFDYIAADFNQDGKVSSQDALAILKYSVGLPTTEQAEWVFVDTNGDYSGVSKSNTSYTGGVSIADLSADTTVGLTGILIGDVNDSYSGLIV